MFYKESHSIYFTLRLSRQVQYKIKNKTMELRNGNLYVAKKDKMLNYGFATYICFYNTIDFFQNLLSKLLSNIYSVDHYNRQYI